SPLFPYTTLFRSLGVGQVPVEPRFPEVLGQGHGHAVVDLADDPFGLGGDDGEATGPLAGLGILPSAPDPGEGHRMPVCPEDPVRGSALFLRLPLVEPVGGDQAAMK